MGFIYNGAPGCNFKSTKLRADIKRHLSRKTWCPCKAADWNIEKAKTTYKDKRSIRYTKHKVSNNAEGNNITDINGTPIQQEHVAAIGVKSISIKPELLPRINDTYVDISVHFQSKNKNMRHFLKSASWLAGVAYVSEFFKVPAAELIKEEYGHVCVHPMLMAGVLRQSTRAPQEKEKLIPVTREKEKEGFVYLVTSPLVDAIKIGSWRSCVKSLRNRYITPYGLKLVIRLGRTTNCAATEKKMHTKFASCRVSCELFRKEFYQEYITGLQELTENCQVYSEETGILEDVIICDVL